MASRLSKPYQTDVLGAFPHWKSPFTDYWGCNVLTPGYMEKRHLEGLNVLYYDGHVKWTKQLNSYEWFLDEPCLS